MSTAENPYFAGACVGDGREGCTVGRIDEPRLPTVITSSWPVNTVEEFGRVAARNSALSPPVPGIDNRRGQELRRHNRTLCAFPIHLGFARPAGRPGKRTTPTDVVWQHTVYIVTLNRRANRIDTDWVR